jgi:hypothetical protein
MSHFWTLQTALGIPKMKKKKGERTSGKNSNSLEKLATRRQPTNLISGLKTYIGRLK